MKITFDPEPEPTPEEKREQLFTPKERWDYPWRYGSWEGKVSVAFGYAESGWILMVLLTTAHNSSAIVHCSDVYDPFPDMRDWLEKIARRDLPADWQVNEEGHFTMLRVKEDPNDCLDFQAWGYSEEVSGKNPPKLIFRTRVSRQQLLSEFNRRFTRYVKEDFDPSQWYIIPDEFEDEWERPPDLRSIDLSFIDDSLGE